MNIHTDYDALTMALALAVTAPSDEQANACLMIADTIAGRLPAAQVEDAKAEACLLAEAYERQGANV